MSFEKLKKRKIRTPQRYKAHLRAVLLFNAPSGSRAWRVQSNHSSGTAARLGTVAERKALYLYTYIYICIYG